MLADLLSQPLRQRVCILAAGKRVAQWPRKRQSSQGFREMPLPAKTIFFGSPHCLALSFTDTICHDPSQTPLLSLIVLHCPKAGVPGTVARWPPNPAAAPLVVRRGRAILPWLIRGVSAFRGLGTGQFPPGDIIVVNGVNSGNLGTVPLRNGVVSYTARPGAHGQDSFTHAARPGELRLAGADLVAVSSAREGSPRGGAVPYSPVPAGLGVGRSRSES
jgi:hypothetical protein